MKKHCVNHSGQMRKPRENVRDIFLYKIFKSRRNKLESIASPHPGKKNKAGWSIHSVKSKPKKNLTKRCARIPDDDSSDIFEDALDEFESSCPRSGVLRADSIRIRILQKDSLVAEIYDPKVGMRKLEFTREQLDSNDFEFVYEPEAKLAILLGDSTIYAVNKIKQIGFVKKTDVAIQTFWPEAEGHSALVETTGKQVSFDELPYDASSFKGFSYPLEKKRPSSVLPFTTSRPLANKLRAKSYASLINNEHYLCSPHTTSLVSSIPSEEVVQLQPFPPLRKFSMKRSFDDFDICRSFQNGLMNRFSEVYVAGILQNLNPINLSDEQELNRISDANALCFISSSSSVDSIRVFSDKSECSENLKGHDKGDVSISEEKCEKKLESKEVTDLNPTEEKPIKTGDCLSPKEQNHITKISKTSSNTSKNFFLPEDEENSKIKEPIDIMDPEKFFGEKPPSPIDPTDIIFDRPEIKKIEERHSRVSGLKTRFENTEHVRPRTSISPDKVPVIERPMTSVSQALRGVESALKPLQDQLKEIRSKMVSLNSPYEFENEAKVEDNFLPMKNKVLPPKLNMDNRMVGRIKTFLENKTASPVSRDSRNYDGLSIWTEPEDIIGDASPSLNFPFIGTKKISK